MNKYELLIYPYQFATPFLKYLLLNKPSLSLFEIDYIEDKVKNDFEPLFKSNILHSSMKNMALFLNKTIIISVHGGSQRDAKSKNFILSKIYQKKDQF